MNMSTQDKIIAVIVFLVIGTGIAILFGGPLVQQGSGIEQQALLDLNDCRTNVYNKPAYEPIRSHLPAPENQFAATPFQLSESSMPTDGERKTLAAYQVENDACKQDALKKFDQANPEQGKKIKETIDKSNGIMQQLIDGKVSWGEAAQQLDKLRK